MSEESMVQRFRICGLIWDDKDGGVSAADKVQKDVHA